MPKFRMNKNTAVSAKALEGLTEMTDKRKIIYNALKTPDGTIIRSRYIHDYVEYVDQNGKTYMIDGGTCYVRCSVNGDETMLTLYDDEPHEVQRQFIDWGTYGKDGNQPFKLVKVAEMEKEHILAVLQNCTVAPYIRNCMERELEERID